MNPRYFWNAPMLSTHAEVARLAAELGAIRIGGYTADDGTKRALLEIDQDTAERLRR